MYVCTCTCYFANVTPILIPIKNRKSNRLHVFSCCKLSFGNEIYLQSCYTILAIIYRHTCMYSSVKDADCRAC